MKGSKIGTAPPLTAGQTAVYSPALAAELPLKKNENAGWILSAGNAADPGGNARKSGAVAPIVDSPHERIFKAVRRHSV